MTEEMLENFELLFEVWKFFSKESSEKIWQKKIVLRNNKTKLDTLWSFYLSLSNYVNLLLIIDFCSVKKD